MELERAWWRQAVAQNLASMVPVPKWRTDRRNVQVGDVVQLEYAGRLVAEYRLARVVCTEPDMDGLVRSVVLRYCLLQGRTRAELERPTGARFKYIRTRVQRLVMLLPVEEQDGETPVSEAEQQAALLAVGPRPLVHQPGAGLLRPEEEAGLPSAGERLAAPPRPAPACHLLLPACVGGVP